VGVGSAGEETGVDEDRCSGIRDFDRRAVSDLFEETEEGDLVVLGIKIDVPVSATVASLSLNKSELRSPFRPTSTSSSLIPSILTLFPDNRHRIRRCRRY
jgi:hypothetical protein